jgi:hypothetical protein
MKFNFSQLPYRISLFFNHLKNPENIWYGGSLTRKTALSSVGKGWSKMINNLYDAKPKGAKVIQVKEKFATLRFYISGNYPSWYEDLVDYYEYKSGTTCEQCGKAGIIRTDRSWIVTLCDDCNNKI